MASTVIGFQIILTAVSAVLGAGVLLWMQTVHLRIKLLRGLEQEIEYNLQSVSRAGTEIYENQDTSAVNGVEFSDDIFRTVKSETPLLFTRMTGGFSLIANAYHDIETLRSLVLGGASLSGDLDQILNDLEMLESHLFLAHQEVNKIQRESSWYRLYNLFVLREMYFRTPSLFAKIELGEGENYREVIWRPSGRNSEEQRETYDGPQNGSS